MGWHVGVRRVCVRNDGARSGDYAGAGVGHRSGAIRTRYVNVLAHATCCHRKQPNPPADRGGGDVAGRGATQRAPDAAWKPSRGWYPRSSVAAVSMHRSSNRNAVARCIPHALSQRVCTCHQARIPSANAGRVSS